MEWGEAIERLGIPVAGLAFVAVCIWRAGHWLGPRIDKWFGGQAELQAKIARQLDDQAATQAAITAAQARISRRLEELSKHSTHLIEIHSDPTSKFSTARTNRAVSLLAHMMSAAFERLSVPQEILDPHLIALDQTLYGVEFRVEKQGFRER